MKLDYAFLADAGFAQRDTGLFSVLNGGVNLIRCLNSWRAARHCLVDVFP